MKILKAFQSKCWIDHCWHTIRKFKETRPEPGHGPHHPRPTKEYEMWERVCCHCGEKRIRTEYEWLWD